MTGSSAASGNSELVVGRVYAMCGGSERHDLAAGLIYELLAPGAEATSLRLLVLVDRDTRRMELARPVGGAIDAWEVRGPGEVLATGGLAPLTRVPTRAGQAGSR